MTVLLSTLLRCMEAAMLPLYASIFAAIVNTGFNYILIFGKFGIPRIGVMGAAWATVLSQSIGCMLILLLLCRHYRKSDMKLGLVLGFRKGKQNTVFENFASDSCL